ncbi:ScbA/BarX family gamma-butyrolactone biosynthesis protein, partial [Streptomyces sp. ERV7]|uniref:ScbA/BarX family gamma-butyrolactone biosynthesis protein n=1 Tax=Streptomyces sp. ERV7 TaxID=1322334 RepID=UPI0009A054A9
QLDVGGQPALIDVELEFSRLEWRGGKLSRLKVHWVLRRLGRLVATGSGQARVLSPGVYRRLRGDRTSPGVSGYLPLPVPADLAGRTRAADVVLAPCPQERVWRLRVDTSHPTLFQRPNDHVPGMLLLEAARQAASAALGPLPFVPVAGDIAFHRYAEFDSTCWIQVTDAAPRRPGMTSVQVTGHQDDSLVFLATLSAPRGD